VNGPTVNAACRPAAVAPGAFATGLALRAGLRLCRATVLLAALVVRAAVAAAEPERIDLVTDLPSAGDLAAPANGQTLFVLGEADGAVTAVDPAAPAKRWNALAAVPAAGDANRGGPPRHVALACIDTSRLAILRSDQDGWSLLVHRVQSGVAADPQDDLLQTVALAAAKPDPGPRPPASATPGIAVSPSRDWLAVYGLPAPAPPLLRAKIEGARVGTASAHGCPPLPADGRPAAAAISLAEELVLFAPEGEGRATPSVFLTFHRHGDPRRLLHLDTGLPTVRDAAFCRATGTLWVVGGTPDSSAVPEGLWRLDAVLRQGRQAVQAACVVRLDAPRAVCCLSERAIAVTHGRTRRIVSLFAPAVDGDRDDAGRGRPPAEQPAEQPAAPAEPRSNEP
jgi:hypothetical protein